MTKIIYEKSTGNIKVIAPDSSDFQGLNPNMDLLNIPDYGSFD